MSTDSAAVAAPASTDSAAAAALVSTDSAAVAAPASTDSAAVAALGSTDSAAAEKICSAEWLVGADSLDDSLEETSASSRSDSLVTLGVALGE